MPTSSSFCVTAVGCVRSNSSGVSRRVPAQLARLAGRCPARVTVKRGSPVCTAVGPNRTKVGLKKAAMSSSEYQGRRASGTAGEIRHRKSAAAPLRAAASETAAPEPSANSKLLVGLAWFFAHQVIGVGNDVIMKYVGSNLGVAQIVFLRFLFAAITMLPFMFLSGLSSFKTNRLMIHFGRSVLLAAGIAGYCVGLNVAPIAVVTTLNFTIPLFTLVFSRVFLKELVGGSRWFATLFGFAGVVVVLQPWALAAFNVQWLIVLASASMFASLDVLNKALVGEESFWSMIFYTAFFTALIAAYPAITSWTAVTTSQLGLLAILGGGANLLLFCLLKSFSLVDASALAPFRYTELILSAAVGYLFFAEIPKMATVMGAVVIIPSTLYVVWNESRGKE